jgi:hypothetical protein
VVAGKGMTSGGHKSHARAHSSFLTRDQTTTWDIYHISDSESIYPSILVQRAKMKITTIQEPMPYPKVKHRTLVSTKV